MAVFSNPKEQSTLDGEVENKVDTNVDVSETELGQGADDLERLDPKAEALLTRRFDCFLIPILGVSPHPAQWW